MKKFFLGLLCASMAVSLLCSCEKDNGNDNQPCPEVETYLYFYKFDEDYHGKMFANNPGGLTMDSRCVELCDGWYMGIYLYGDAVTDVTVEEYIAYINAPKDEKQPPLFTEDRVMKNDVFKDIEVFACKLDDELVKDLYAAAWWLYEELSEEYEEKLVQTVNTLNKMIQDGSLFSYEGIRKCYFDTNKRCLRLGDWVNKDKK